MKKITLITSVLLLLLFSCQKETQTNLQDEPVSRSVASTPKAEHNSAQVAIDWYKLQLRKMLYRFHRSKTCE